MIKWPWTSTSKNQDADADSEQLRLRTAGVDCKVCALHKVDISQDELRHKIEEDPHWTSLPWDYLIELVEKLYIFDVRFSDAGMVPHLLMETDQVNDQGQAPFLERYFDDGGQKELFTDLEQYEREPPMAATYPCRVRFFLHFADEESPLDIAGKRLELPDATPLPNWLRDLMPYQPPN
jgi:hypothetical protein